MGPFPEEGSASHAQYFTKGVKANSCDLVTFPTAYSLYNSSDYKRCVCDSWFMDESDCIYGTPGDQEALPSTDPAESGDRRSPDQKPHKQQESDKQKSQKDSKGDQDQDQGQKKEGEKKPTSDQDEQTKPEDPTKTEDTDKPSVPPTGRSTKTKADVHQPSTAQRMAAQTGAETPKPGNAVASAVNAVALCALASFLAY